jgi:tetratricopeptide (TPR) repeat protein
MRRISTRKNRGKAGAIVFGALFCLTVASGWQQSAQPIISALRNKQYADALKLAEQALKTAPRNAQILTLEGLAYRGLARDQDALAAFHGALAADPGYVAALEGAAQIEYAAGRPEAVPLLDRLLKLRPADPTAHAMRGVMAWKQRDCTAATAHFERSGAALATQPEALREYGVCLVRLERLAAAERVFQQLVSANPAAASARRSLAAVQLMAERTQAALDSLQPLLKAEGADPETMALASAVYERLGDTPNAVASLRQAIVLSPRTVKYYLDFASLSFAHKSFDAGIRVVTAGLSLSPESPELHLARGILYVQTGKTDQADADFAVAERLDPRQPGAVDAHVLERLQVNDLDGAAKLVREQIKARPNNAFLHYLLAEVLNWQGPPVGSPDFQQALNAATEAVKLQPDLVLARNLLSRLYMDAGQLKPAIEQCREVLRTSPHDPIALYRLMRALKMSDDPDSAKEIPDVVRRFNEARELATKKEAQESRYRLLEAPSGGARNQ